MRTIRQWSFWLPLVVIVIVVTIGYMMIYANNPFMEIASVVRSLASGSMQNASAPDLVGITDWINTPNNAPITLNDLKGKVVLIDFWTYSCINCQRDLPYVVGWDEKYRPYGLEIIGVHTPEFRFEQNVANVQAAVQKYHIPFPVALDNGYKTWRAFHNLYWPAKYLIDANGKIVYMRFGEGGYDQFEQKIKALLQDATFEKVEQIRQQINTDQKQ